MASRNGHSESARQITVGVIAARKDISCSGHGKRVLARAHHLSAFVQADRRPKRNTKPDEDGPHSVHSQHGALQSQATAPAEDRSAQQARQPAGCVLMGGCCARHRI